MSCGASFAQSCYQYRGPSNHLHDGVPNLPNLQRVPVFSIPRSQARLLRALRVPRRPAPGRGQVVEEQARRRAQGSELGGEAGDGDDQPGKPVAGEESLCISSVFCFLRMRSSTTNERYLIL